MKKEERSGAQALVDSLAKAGTEKIKKVLDWLPLDAASAGLSSGNVNVDAANE